MIKKSFMANEQLFRRCLIQKASALLLASSIIPTLFEQVNKSFSYKDIEPVYVPPGAGLKGKIA